MWLTGCVCAPNGCSHSGVGKEPGSTAHRQLAERDFSMNENEIDIRAAEWLARLDRGDAASELIDEFNHWRDLDARHGAAYARLAATWQALDRVQVLQPTLDATIQPDYLREQGRPASGRSKAAAFAVAASVVIAAALWACRLPPR